VLGLRYAAPDESVTGGVLEGSVQAAITRPFADEFRTLEDNSALLTQVAEMTGGRVLAGDPVKDALWERKGLTMPVALTPIWLVVAAIAIGLFLVDVGVRRVRIDIMGWARSMRRGLSREKKAAGAEMGALREARASAQQKMAERAARSGKSEGAEPASRAAIREDRKQAEQTAKAKFEASPEQLKRGDAPIAMGGAEATPRDMRPYVAPAGETKKAVDAAEGMSRLLKAKQKARDDMTDEKGGKQ
jgi:hypothetical protein